MDQTKIKPLNGFPSFYYLYNLIYRVCDDVENKAFISDTEQTDQALTHKLDSLLDAAESNLEEDHPILKSLELISNVLKAKSLSGVYLLNNEEIDSDLIYIALAKNLHKIKILIVSSILQRIKERLLYFKEKHGVEESAKILSEAVILADIKHLCKSKVDIVEGRTISMSKLIEDKVHNRLSDKHLSRIISNALAMKSNNTNEPHSEFIKYFGRVN